MSRVRLRQKVVSGGSMLKHAVFLAATAAKGAAIAYVGLGLVLYGLDHGLVCVAYVKNRLDGF